MYFKKCLLTMRNKTFYNFCGTDFPKTSSCDLKSTPFSCKAPFSHLGPGPVLALTSEDLSRFWILRSSVMLNRRIAPRFPENPFYCISQFFLFVTTIPLLTQGKHMLISIILLKLRTCLWVAPISFKIRILLCCSILDFGQRSRATILRRS